MLRRLLGRFSPDLHETWHAHAGVSRGQPVEGRDDLDLFLQGHRQCLSYNMRETLQNHQIWHGEYSHECLEPVCVGDLDLMLKVTDIVYILIWGDVH